MSRSIVVLALVLGLAGCAAWTLVQTERQTLAGRYTVAPQIQRSRIRHSDAELWTVDGLALQALRFFDAIEDGEPLFDPGSQSDDKLPVFRRNMSATEVQEFLVHSVQRSGGARVEASGLRPWKLGRVSGFRFELDFLNESGLEMQGVVAGAVDDGRLYLIAYTGTRAHYFPKYLPAVERILESVDTAI
jgi:hypothetical protein